MKRFITILLLATATSIYAQPTTLTQAIISTKTTIISPETDEDMAPPPASAHGEEVRVMRFGGDGETKTTTYLKNDMVKTVSNSEMGNTTIIRDNKNKKTTTLMEMMGRKTGFYATDEEQEGMRKRMDSMMQSRTGEQPAANASPAYEITYSNETKKIAGFQCKKAIMIASSAKGKKDSSIVWYCPDFKLAGISTTGGAGGGMFNSISRSGAATGLNMINGFPMQYEMNMRRGRKMIVEITKVETGKEIADKEFEIPRGFEVKSVKDMESGAMPGSFQMRIGN